MICPCQKQQTNAQRYNTCCKVFHDGELAPTAEKLMRSRFSAYALGLSTYLKDTWHSSTRPNPLEAEPDDQWLKLDIISFSDNTVHFKAFYKEDNAFAFLEEHSRFTHEHGRIVYLSGETKVDNVNLKRNDTCLCGSDKKFKKCCAAD